MIVTLYDYNPFKDFIDLIYDSTNTVKLVFGNEGLRINLLNNSHICFYGAEYDTGFFELYDVEEYTELILDTKDLFLVLKSANKNETLTIQSGEYDVIFLFESESNRRQFNLSLIDEEYESPQPPSIDYSMDFIMDWSDLKQCCNDLDKIVGTDRFNIISDDTGVHIISPKNSMTQYNNIIHNPTGTSANTIVNVEYILQLSKLSKNGDIRFSIGTDIPLSWKIDGGDVLYTGLIAPIFEED